MALYTETAHEQVWLKREWDDLFNREVVTIASGNALSDGTVLGKITASGKYAAYDDTETDGTQTAVGILLGDVDASSADKTAAILARGPAVVSEGDLIGIDTAGKVDLAAIGIVVRQTV